MAWTTVSKPSSSWTSVSKPSTSYTNVTKPARGFTISLGKATGLLTPPTYAQNTTVGVPWTLIAKPNG